VIKAIILDLLAGSWSVISLLFALVVLPEGQTQQTMAALFIGLTVVWIATGPLRWRE
jgi:hypothetical protein